MLLKRIYRLADGRTLVIRPYQPGDQEQILALFKLVFGTSKSLAHWHWEFLENPYGCLIMLAFLQGRLVAQCAGIPVFLHHRGRTIKAAQVVDCMSHPAHRAVAVRKKGIFALTVETFFQAYTGCGKAEYVYGFPGIRHYRLGSLVLGYKKTTQAMEVQVFPSPRGKTKIELFSSQDFSLPPSHLLKHPYPSDFYVLKTPEYFTWRYLNVPHKTYTIALIKNRLGSPRGLVVLEKHKDEWRALDVLGDISIPEALSATASYLNSPLTAWFPEHLPLKQEFLKIKAEIEKPFLPIIPAGISFCRNCIPWDEANKSFFYTMGDTDLF